MSDTLLLQEIRRIVAADLPSATESVALRLVLRASPENGQVNLIWDEYLSMCKGKNAHQPNRDAARRHLIALGRRHLIHYSTNDNIYVTFLGWLMTELNYQSGQPPTGIARESAILVEEDLNQDTPTEIARESAIIALTRAGIARESAIPVEINKYSSSSNSDVYQFRSELIARSRQMLRECGIFPEDAKRFSEATPFEELRAHIFTWRNDPRATGPGALKHRIDHDFSRFALTDADRLTSFYIRFRTPEEEYATELEPAALLRCDRCGRFVPECDLVVSGDDSDECICLACDRLAQPEPVPPISLQAINTASEHYRVWVSVLSDLEMEMKPGSYALWLRDTLPLSTDGVDWIIGVPDRQGIDWLRSRMVNKIQRQLSFIARQPITLEFRAMAEVAHEH